MSVTPYISMVLRLLLSVLPCISMVEAQTRIAPLQVKAWLQVAPPPGSADRQWFLGTKLQLAQVAIPKLVVESWTLTIVGRSYDHYSVAVVSDRAGPILIVCVRPEADPLGPGCVGGLFWFAVVPVNRP